LSSSSIYIEKEGFEEFFNLSYSDEMLEHIYTWACKKYSDKTTNKDLCSFAALIEYFSTGWYGGYGTELYEKERLIETQARHLYTTLNPEFSEKEKSLNLIKFIENCYFN